MRLPDDNINEVKVAQVCVYCVNVKICDSLTFWNVLQIKEYGLIVKYLQLKNKHHNGVNMVVCGSYFS